MQNKIKTMLLFVAIFFGGISVCRAEYGSEFNDSIDVTETLEINDTDANEEFSAYAIEDYQIEGSLFQQITELEQEKVLMQLEKERAQLNLDLDRLAAEKIKLNMEIDTLSGRAEQQQQEFETERMRLETEAKRLEREKEALDNQESEPVKSTTSQKSYIAEEKSQDAGIEKNYKLLNVFGAGSQLQATIQDLSSGQNKRLSVGKTLDGYKVKSISLDDGVVFVKDGETETLNIGTKN
jgi:type IV pilus biogenesis protein PilP